MYCKLTQPDRTTYAGFHWTPRTWYRADGIRGLCTSSWFHGYAHPLLAVTMNPIHGCFGDTALLWTLETRGRVISDDIGLKIGTTECRIIEQIDKPVISTNARLRWVIQLTQMIHGGTLFNDWAEGWLDGSDRSVDTARFVARKLGCARWSHTIEVATEVPRIVVNARRRMPRYTPRPSLTLATARAVQRAARRAQASGKLLPVLETLQQAIAEEHGLS